MSGCVAFSTPFPCDILQDWSGRSSAAEAWLGFEPPPAPFLRRAAPPQQQRDSRDSSSRPSEPREEELDSELREIPSFWGVYDPRGEFERLRKSSFCP